MGTHWIVNAKQQTFLEVEDFGFNGEWKEEFPHTARVAWVDVAAFLISDDERVENGIPFVYDLCPDGARFTLLVDRDVHDEEEVNAAKAELRHKRDVVSLQVLRLRKAKAGEGA